MGGKSKSLNHERRYPAHHAPIERFGEPIVMFCTVCIQDKHNILDNAKAVDALVKAWRQAVQWRVGEFVCMPDHVHWFCVPGVVHPERISLWCRYWKRLASQCNPTLKGHWQTDVWDTQMRNADHYAEKLSYMRRNPVRKGMVSHWEQWPYRGKLHTISW